ncbi:MAG: hypothetical protein ACTSVI_03145 [Promethearchaeota archaeon]
MMEKVEKKEISPVIIFYLDGFVRFAVFRASITWNTFQGSFRICGRQIKSH